MTTKIFQGLSIALAVTLALVIVFHNLIWPCDIATEAANVSTTFTIEKMDTTPSKVERSNLEPLAVVPRKPLPRPEPPVSWNGPTDQPPVVHLSGDQLFYSGKWYIDMDAAALVQCNETAFYSQTELDSATQVKVTVNDSIRGNRIAWRSYQFQNHRPISVTNTTDVRPDRLQVYIGPRMGAFQLNANQWNYMVGIGGRIKFKKNYALGASYLQGTNQDVRAIMAEADFLLRWPKLGQRIREKRLIRLSNK